MKKYLLMFCYFYWVLSVFCFCVAFILFFNFIFTVLGISSLALRLVFIVLMVKIRPSNMLELSVMIGGISFLVVFFDQLDNVIA